MYFQNMSENPMISKLYFFVTSHFGTLFARFFVLLLSCFLFAFFVSCRLNYVTTSTLILSKVRFIQKL